MPKFTFPDLTATQVVVLQDELLANADRLLTSAIAVFDLGHTGLAQSLAILGLEESGKTIAIQERRAAMAYLEEGAAFRCGDLDRLWVSHRAKLMRVHEFLVREDYWFGDPPDPLVNERALGDIESWATSRNLAKQRGFYVDLDEAGNAVPPGPQDGDGSLRETLEHIHQIGWQLRLGEHIEMRRQQMVDEIAPAEDDGSGRLRNRDYAFTHREPIPAGDLGYEAMDRELTRFQDSLER